jgi:hypothetical protein
MMVVMTTMIMMMMMMMMTLLNNGGDMNNLHNLYALMHSTSMRISINYCTSTHWGRAVA